MDQEKKPSGRSKVAAAKERQAYNPSPAAKTCGNCLHFVSERALPEWMARSNESGRNRPFKVENYGIETNKRCGIGGFAVKKMATCNEFKRKEGA